MDEELITEYVIADCPALPIPDKAWHAAEYLRNLKNGHPLNCYDDGFYIILNTPVHRYIKSNFKCVRFDDLVWRFVEAYFYRSDQVLQHGSGHRLLACELFASYNSKSIKDLFQEFVDAELEKLDQILGRIDWLILTRYSVERCSGSNTSTLSRRPPPRSRRRTCATPSNPRSQPQLSMDSESDRCEGIVC
jgi:hypothetical protein